MEATSDRTDARLASASVWRVIIVLALSLFTLVLNAPDVALPWYPTAEFGLVADATGRVVSVEPGSSSAREDVRVGDVIDFRATSIDARRYFDLGAGNTVQPGTRAAIVFDRKGVLRTVDLVGEVVPRSFADNASDELLIITEVGLTLIAAFLVLKRPSRMTWAFFLYSTTNASEFSGVLVSVVPGVPMAMMFGISSLYFFQSIWLFLFALRFPNDAVSGWRRTAERATLVLLPLLVPLNVWVLDGFMLGFPPSPAAVAIGAFIGVAGLVAAAFTFIATYVHASGADRARVRWVMLGLVVGFSGTLIVGVGVALPGFAFSWPIWLINLALSTQIVVAISVAYAVIRHRVFDVRFFIGRAVVYATITAMVVAALSLVDLAAGKVLAGTGLAAIGEAGLAVIVGLSLSGVHKRVERFVDTTLFRSRIVAQARLRRVSRGLSHAATLEDVEYAVVHEPVAAFALTSAALFRRDATGTFARVEAIGWDHAALATIAGGDPLVLQLLGSNEPIAVREMTLPPGALPIGALRPSLALPMRIRSEIEAIVFYGPHDTEEELDPAEIETLDRLLGDASAAYDHVRAHVAQQRIADLETQNAQLRALRIVS